MGKKKSSDSCSRVVMPCMNFAPLHKKLPRVSNLNTLTKYQ